MSGASPPRRPGPARLPSPTRLTAPTRLTSPTRLLCREAEIPEGGGKGFVLGSGAERRAILIVRKGGAVFAYENACPHRGTPLDWRPDQFFTADHERLLCAMHGAIFRPEDGFCLAGPCAGKSLSRVEIIRKGDELHIA